MFKTDMHRAEIIKDIEETLTIFIENGLLIENDLK